MRTKTEHHNLLRTPTSHRHDTIPTLAFIKLNPVSIGVGICLPSTWGCQLSTWLSHIVAMVQFGDQDIVGSLCFLYTPSISSRHSGASCWSNALMSSCRAHSTRHEQAVIPKRPNHNGMRSPNLTEECKCEVRSKPPSSGLCTSNA